MSFDLVDVFDAWIADRKLSRRQLAFLHQCHEQTMETVGCGLPMTAGWMYCSELDLPQGSQWGHCTAELLDFLRPRKGISRLAELLREQLECGEIEEDFYDCFDR